MSGQGGLSSRASMRWMVVDLLQDITRSVLVFENRTSIARYLASKILLTSKHGFIESVWREQLADQHSYRKQTTYKTPPVKEQTNNRLHKYNRTTRTDHSIIIEFLTHLSLPSVSPLCLSPVSVQWPNPPFLSPPAFFSSFFFLSSSSTHKLPLFHPSSSFLLPSPSSFLFFLSSSSFSYSHFTVYLLPPFLLISVPCSLQCARST